MDKATAKAIKDAAEEIGCEVRIDDGYSGRGMYGKTTNAIVCTQTTLLRCVALAAARIQEHVLETVPGDEGDESNNQLDVFIEDLSFRSDSLGYDTVWY